MATLDEIRNSDFYINASPEVKQRIESNYAKQNPSTPIEGKPGIVEGANVQSDIPSTNPETYKPVANGQSDTPSTNSETYTPVNKGFSWEDIVRSPFFQDADDETRDKIRENFDKAGGKLPSVGAEAVNTGLVAAGSIANETLKQVGGAGYYTLGVLKKIDSGINSVFGTDPNSSLVTQWANAGQEHIDNSLKALEQSYQENVGEMAKESPLLRNTEKYAPAVEQGVEAVATGGISILPRAIGYAGEHYHETPEEQRDLARSATMGAINYGLNKVVPGSNIAGKVENSLFDVAAPRVNQILAKGISKVAGATTAGVHGATITGVGSGIATAADVGMSGGTAEEAINAGVESAKESAVSGGIIGAGFHVVTSPTPFKLTPDENKKFESSVDEINKAAKDGDFNIRDQHLANADTYVYSMAAKTLEDHGFQPIKQTVKAGKGAETVYGVSREEAQKNVLDPEATKQNIKDTQESIDKTHDSAYAANEALFKSMGHVENEPSSSTTKIHDKLLKDVIKSIRNLHAEYRYGKSAFNSEHATNLATEVTHKIVNLNKIAPEEAQFLIANLTSPVTGKKGNVDFQSDAHVNTAQRKMLFATRDAIKPTVKGDLKQIAKRVASHGIKHYVANHLFGVEGNLGLAAGEAIYGKSKTTLNSVRRNIQSEKMAANANKNITASYVEPTIIPKIEFTTHEGRAKARVERTTKAAVTEAKAKFADHPEIAAKINETNYRDLTPFAQERAQARTSARQEARAAEKATAAKQEAETNQKQVNQFKSDNPHLKSFFRDAENNVKASGKDLTSHNFEKAVNDLASGKVATSTGEKIKAPFKAGSREEFLEDVRKNKLVPEEVKAEQRALIKLYHEGLKPGETLSTKAQQNLHRSLANEESKFFTKHGKDVEAEAAKERGEEFAKRVTSRAETFKRNYQTEQLHKTIQDELKEAGLSERKTNKFIKAKTNEFNKMDSMNDTEFKNHLENVRKEAAELTGESVKPNEPTAKTGERIKPEEGGLSDTQITHTREKYTHELTDKLGSKDFDKHLDELEAFREEYDLPDTATNARFDHYVDALVKIHELKLKGVDDPQALISKEMVKRFTKQGIQYGKWLRDSLGINEADILPEAKRKALEEDITSGKQAKREAIKKRGKGTLGAGTKRTTIKGAIPRRPSEPNTREPTRPPEPDEGVVRTPRRPQE